MTQFDAFMPHGMCYMWRWDMLLLQVGSDLLIALAYFSIPAALVALMRKRPDLPQGILQEPLINSTDALASRRDHW